MFSDIEFDACFCQQEEELKDTEDSVDVDALRSQVSALQKQKEDLDVSRKRLE